MILTNLKRSFFLSPPLWGGWVGLLLLFSCGKEDFGEQMPVNPEEERIPIRFEIGFGAETRVTTNVNLTSTWQDGDEIGVFIVKGNAGLQSSGNHVDNLKLTYSVDSLWRAGWTQEALPTGKEYYPTDGEPLSFYAYYPYSASIDPTNAPFFVKGFQNSEAGYNNSELLLAKTLEYRLDPQAIPLNFSHAHALLQIEVVQQGTVIPDDRLELDLTNVAISVNVNLATGTDTETTQNGVVRMYKVPGMNATYRALIPPQTLNGNSELVFLADLTDRGVYIGLQSVTLTAGKVHKYKLTATDLGL